MKHSWFSLTTNKRFIKQQHNLVVKWHGLNPTFPFLHSGCFYADWPAVLCLFCAEHDGEKFQTKGDRRSCTGWESNPLHIQLASEMIYEVESENTNGTLHSLNGIIESPKTKKNVIQINPFTVITPHTRWSGENAVAWPLQAQALYNIYFPQI